MRPDDVGHSPNDVPQAAIGTRVRTEARDDAGTPETGSVRYLNCPNCASTISGAAVTITAAPFDIIAAPSGAAISICFARGAKLDMSRGDASEGDEEQ